MRAGESSPLLPLMLWHRVHKQPMSQLNFRIASLESASPTSRGSSRHPRSRIPSRFQNKRYPTPLRSHKNPRRQNQVPPQILKKRRHSKPNPRAQKSKLIEPSTRIIYDEGERRGIYTMTLESALTKGPDRIRSATRRN